MNTNLRSLADYKGQELIDGVLRIVDRVRPLHLSIVGGDPLVRYREMDVLVPKLIERGVHVQLVTSAFRQINPEWANYDKFNLVVSIDGLQPEHDARRKPATYERILKNIEGQHITVHSTITSQMMRRAGYLEEFTEFWSNNKNVRKIWFSIFTPQVGETYEECLSPTERERAVFTLMQLRKTFPKIDMAEGLLKEYLRPPTSPAECVFAQTTTTISADLSTKITPCQFGGTPDCSQCGCIASAGLAAVGHYKVLGPLTAGHLFFASLKVGKLFKKRWEIPAARPQEPLVQLRTSSGT